MQFRILGPVELWRDGQPVALAPKQQVVLAALLLHANQVVPAGWLVEQLWGTQPPATARKTLQSLVLRLRRALPPGTLLTREPGYLLRVEADQLDLSCFQQLVGEAATAAAEGDSGRAAQRLREALALWRGPALAGVDSDALQQTEVPRLEELRLGALEARVDAELRLGRHAELVGELRALVAEHPLRERFWEQLMLALYRAGRQAEALDAYRQLRRRLVEELGIEPSPPVQRLQREILNAAPGLALADTTASPAEGARARPGQGMAAVVPRQLPPDAASFTGRERELERLCELLSGGGQRGAVPIVALDGAAGVGKSAVAARAAHQLAGQFPDGQLYADLQGATPGLAPLPPLEVLSRFLRAFGVDGQRLPVNVEEAAALFRSLAAGRRLLLVLDNAATAEQVRPLLPASPSCAVLVTSRQLLSGIHGAEHLHLDVLPADEAVRLLGHLAGPERIAAEPEAAVALAQLCGYLPLALRIAGARLAARPAWPVRALVERLADERRRLDELSLGDLAVRTSLQVSYHALDPQVARLFRLLGLLDGPDVGVPVVAALLDQPVEATEAALERLVDARLLESLAPGRYRFHDLLRLFARERAAAEEPPPARAAALTRAFRTCREISDPYGEGITLKRLGGVSCRQRR